MINHRAYGTVFVTILEFAYDIAMLVDKLFKTNKLVDMVIK